LLFSSDIANNYYNYLYIKLKFVHFAQNICGLIIRSLTMYFETPLDKKY